MWKTFKIFGPLEKRVATSSPYHFRHTHTLCIQNAETLTFSSSLYHRNEKKNISSNILMLLKLKLFLHKYSYSMPCTNRFVRVRFHGLLKISVASEKLMFLSFTSIYVYGWRSQVSFQVVFGHERKDIIRISIIDRCHLIPHLKKC